MSANRNRKGGPKAAGWRLAANRFPEMRIGKHMGSGNRDFAAVLMLSGLHPADARRVTKIRPCSRRRQCVGRAVPAPEFFEHRSHARTYGQRPPRPPKVAFSRSSPPRAKETDRVGGLREAAGRRPVVNYRPGSIPTSSRWPSPRARQRRRATLSSAVMARSVTTSPRRASPRCRRA